MKLKLFTLKLLKHIEIEIKIIQIKIEIKLLKHIEIEIKIIKIKIKIIKTY